MKNQEITTLVLEGPGGNEEINVMTFDIDFKNKEITFKDGRCKVVTKSFYKIENGKFYI